MSTGMATRQAAQMTAWTPTFAMSVDDAVAQVRMKREFMARVMVEDVHYGSLPGTREDKKCLFKPGAELLLSAMGLHAELTDAAPPTLDITGRDHGGEPFIEYRRTCAIYRQIGPDEVGRMLIARAEGSCSSWEVKYRYRNAQRRCPDCEQETIIKGKAEYGGGWVCHRPKGGCGQKFQDGDLRIERQELGRIKNPEVADVANTILKMADKRAFVAATLLATGCSDIFTQDIVDEDEAGGQGDDNEPGTSRRASGTGRQGGRGNGRAASGITDEQKAELQALNDRLGDKKWSPALLNGKASGLGYEKVKAELEALLAKAGSAAAPEPDQQEPPA